MVHVKGNCNNITNDNSNSTDSDECKVPHSASHWCVVLCALVTLPSGAAARARLSLVTFFGKTKKVTSRRATPGLVVGYYA